MWFSCLERCTVPHCLLLFSITVKLVEDCTDYLGERANPASLFSPPRHIQITRKVHLHQMWDVIYMAHLPFPIYIALVISQPVDGDSRLKLCLIYLADLYIQANHLPTAEMYLNCGLFIPGTPGESPPYFFFLIWITVTHSVRLCSFWKVFLPPLQLIQNAAAMLEGEISAAASCEFQNWFFKILLSWLSWLCPMAISQSLKSCASQSTVRGP